MSKIIIHSDIGCDELALNVVSEVMKQGKISNDGNQYCYATVFAQEGERIICTCDWNKKDTFTFKVYISEEINNDNRNEINFNEHTPEYEPSNSLQQFTLGKW